MGDKVNESYDKFFSPVPSQLGGGCVCVVEVENRPRPDFVSNLKLSGRNSIRKYVGTYVLNTLGRRPLYQVGTQ